MRICSGCKKEKPLSDFSIRKSKHWTGKNARCRRCLADYIVKYLKNNPDKKRLKRDTNNKRRHELFDFVRKLKEGTPCKDCREKYHYCAMQFDHLDSDKKIQTISYMIRQIYSLDKLKEEIAKCEIVCANCHAIRTHGRIVAKGISRQVS